MAKNGLHLIKPSTVDKTGTGSTATISANGSVEFSACVTLSLNGVFSTDYDNYMIVCREKAASAAGYGLYFRLRASGSDNSTASSYTYQRIYANSTSVSGTRSTDNQFYLYDMSGGERGFINYLYGPYLSQPTAIRSVPSLGYLSTISETAGTHNQSTSYDGLSIILQSGTTFTGRIAVYGMRK